MDSKLWKTHLTISNSTTDAIIQDGDIYIVASYVGDARKKLFELCDDCWTKYIGNGVEGEAVIRFTALTLEKFVIL